MRTSPRRPLHKKYRVCGVDYAMVDFFLQFLLEISFTLPGVVVWGGG